MQKVRKLKRVATRSIYFEMVISGKYATYRVGGQMILVVHVVDLNKPLFHIAPPTPYFQSVLPFSGRTTSLSSGTSQPFFHTSVVSPAVHFCCRTFVVKKKQKTNRISIAGLHSLRFDERFTSLKIEKGIVK